MLEKRRKNNRLILLALAIAVLYQIAIPQARRPAVARPFVEGELLIKLESNMKDASAELSFSLMGASVVEEIPFSDWRRIKLPAGVPVERAIEQYRALAGVVSAQPNYIYRIAVTPNDPSFGSLYGMNNIQAPAAWNTTSGDASVVVAVLDTGIRYTHEDLSANIWRNPGEVAANGVDDDGNGFVDDALGYDFINSDSDPWDDNGHGTHVSGTIGAAGNNSLGVAGVSWSVSLMALKTHDNAGNSTSTAVINAFNYVAMMKNRGVNIRVTNNSWSGAPEAPGYDQALKDAIDAAGAAGVLNVFAAGNSNLNIDSAPAYPASYDSPSILAVASSTSSDSRSSFSNFGVAGVDLAAPGSGILSTHRSNDSSYITLSGTSMAAPHVAGAAALLAASNPSLSNLSLKATLLNTVDVLPQWAGLVLTGGRLNIASAIANPALCDFLVQSANEFFQPSGGSGTVTIDSSANCDWTVLGKPNWIGLSTPATGSGDGTVTYIVAANNSGVARHAQLNIAGQSYSIVQDGGADSDCATILAPDSKAFPGGGGARALNVNTGQRCGWVVTSNVSWIGFTPATGGVGSGSLMMTAQPNAGPRRKAKITVNGVTFTIKQKAG
jgi:subtilisin family serine protease